MSAEEPDYSKLPLDERIAHKVWKVRLEAYQEITAQFQKSANEHDECFTPYISNPEIFKKIVIDSNVAAQEAGITALCVLLEYSGPTACIKLRSAVVPGLCEKGLTSAKAATKQKTTDALMWLVELDTPDPVIELMLPYLTAKLPKLVSGTVKTLCEIYTQFGARTVNPKLVLPSLPKLFSHADRNVRAETSNLTVELYKWMGPALEQVLFAELKPVQQKDLTKAFEKVKDEKPTQTRYLKSQREAMEAEKDQGGAATSPDDSDVVMGGAEDSADAAPLDPYDMVDPVNVLGKIPSDLATRVAAAKWKDRVEVLTETQKEMNAMKYADDDYLDLVRILAKCQKDANIQVVSLAANCIELMAKGLRQRFHKYYQIVLSPLLERCKEKKPSVLDALNGALDAVFASTSLTDVLQETLEAMKHKTPQVRLASCQFLIRCMKNTLSAPTKSEIDEIVTAAKKLVGDTLPDVRTCGFEAVGTLMKITGERELNAALDSIDDIKMKKIKEFFENAEVKAKLSAPKPRAPVAAASSSAPSSRTTKTASSSSSAASAKRRSMIGKPGGLSSTGATSLKKKTATSSTANGSTIPSKRGPTSPLKDPSTSRLGALGNRGLTGRSLQSSSVSAATTQQQQQQHASVTRDTGMSAAEKAELEQLRKEKQVWVQSQEKLDWQVQESFAESSRLMKEIETMQAKIDKLGEQHTNDIMTIKSKETQLQRAHSDLEIARLKISQLENEIELIQKQKSSSLNLFDSSTTGTISSTTNGFENDRFKSSFSPLQESNGLRSSISGTSGSLSGGKSPLEGLDRGVGSLSIDGEQKENGNNVGLSRTMLDTNDESWRRAAEVTSQLKARIEKMKAKSRNTAYRG
ncbi:Spindle pole body component alp14 [Cyberlindnera fabianii]|uniref:Spindle pole body component alp14 n=1 Tax=Cyberlindnera fabianii TaxID=36022 RepID=A0A1V2LAK7_CYBFA|nr:Spindle pole body component alp14 [Cyberlindnera fabianii]